MIDISDIYHLRIIHLFFQASIKKHETNEILLIIDYVVFVHEVKEI